MSEPYGIKTDCVPQGEHNVHSFSIDGVIVTVTGRGGKFLAKGADGTTNLNGRRLSTEKTGCGSDDQPKIRVTFDPPVRRFNCYMASNPGLESTPPYVRCYGPTGDYNFGPGLTKPTYPSTGKYGGGTPANDEWLFTHADLTHGQFWYLSFVPDEA